MKRICLLLVSVSLINSLYAQQWITYTNYGLSNGVNAIAIDAKGNKWFGTDGSGVVKFDGVNWTTFKTNNGLADNYIASIVVDPHGPIWFGTYNNGVSELAGNVWAIYNTDNGLLNNFVNAIAIDAMGDKWFGFNSGNAVAEFDDMAWSYFVNNGFLNGVTSIAIEPYSNVWIGSKENGVFKFSDSKWTTYTSKNNLADNSVLAIAIDAQDNEWFGTKSGVTKFDGVNWTTYLDGQTVNAIAFDTKGNKWFGIAFGGVSKFDDTNWTTYIIDDGLVDNNVLSIAIDTADNKWFGTSNGISVFNETGVINAIPESRVMQLSPVVYPNPAKDFINVKYCPSDNEKPLLIIFDINGRRWITQQLNQTQTKVRITNLSSGIYTYEIIGNATNIKPGRFVKD